MNKAFKTNRGVELVTSHSSGYERPASFCKPIHYIINYSTSICPFESGKSGKEEEKLQKFKDLENKKSFSDEMKNIFYSSCRGII